MFLLLYQQTITVLSVQEPILKFIRKNHFISMFGCSRILTLMILDKHLWTMTSVYYLIIDDICQAWSDKFLDIAHKHIPNRKILVRPNDSPWYSSKLRLMKQKMLRLFHSFTRANSVANWKSYRKARNDYQYALDKAEEDNKTSLTDSLSDNKKF